MGMFTPKVSISTCTCLTSTASCRVNSHQRVGKDTSVLKRKVQKLYSLFTAVLMAYRLSGDRIGLETSLKNPALRGPFFRRKHTEKFLRAAIFSLNTSRFRKLG